MYTIPAGFFSFYSRYCIIILIQGLIVRSFAFAVYNNSLFNQNKKIILPIHNIKRRSESFPLTGLYYHKNDLPSLTTGLAHRADNRIDTQKLTTALTHKTWARKITANHPIIQRRQPMNTSTRSDLPGSNEFFTHDLYIPSNSEICFTSAVSISLIVSGDGQIEYQDKKVSIRKGDILFFPKHALFTLTYTEYLQIYEINIMRHYFEVFSPEMENVSFRHFHISENAQDSRCNNIYRHLAIFINSWQNSASDMETVISLGNLFLLILKDFQIQTKSSEQSRDYIQDRISQIIQYITNRYMYKLSVPDISSHIGLTPHYFSTFFIKHFKMSFVDFLNRYRINHSLHPLIHSDSNITDIALDCGFQTYKAYSNAFQKLLGISPSEYRYQNTLPSADSPNGVDELRFHKSVFDFLQIYLTRETGNSFSVESISMHIDADILHQPPQMSDHRFSGISVGSCYQLLQDSVYKQLALAASECRFTYVHFRDLFCDLLNVYTEPSPMQPVFTWEFLEDVFKRIKQLHLYPFIEIGYMPSELASSRDTFPLGYHPCIAKPKSILLWQSMIRSFLNYFSHLFGMEELRSWKFGFWNSANIQSAEGYWSGTKEEFFELYLSTFRVFQEFSLENTLGSPNFSIPGGLQWYHDFLQMCLKERICPAFLDTHLFSCPDHLPDFKGIFPHTSLTSNYLSLTKTDYIVNSICELRKILDQYGFTDVPIISGEWNITFYLSDLIRDTAFMSSFVIHTWINTMKITNGLIYSYLSDISEQYRPSGIPFSGSQGLISRNGLTKPAYHALYLLYKLDKDVVYYNYPCLITRGKNQWHVLLYNISDYNKNEKNNPDYLLDDYRYNAFKSTKSILFHGTIALPPGHYQLIQYRLDREHGCPYDMWLQMGKPQPLTEEITKALSQSSGPKLHFQQLNLHKNWNLDVEIPPHTILLYEIRQDTGTVLSSC